MEPRPVRSMLFVPGNEERYVDKARASGADAVVFDLESAVPAAERPRARSVVAEVLDRFGHADPLLFVRVNEAGSPEMLADLDAVVRPGLAGLLLPQVVGVDDVLRLARELDAREAPAGLAPRSIVIDPLLETPQALRQGYELATCSPRVAYMGAGISRRGDIARRLGYRWTPAGLETLYIRSKILLDVRAAGIAFPLSGMWGDVADLDGLRRLAEQTRDLGYSGMLAIHPTHVPIINEVFTPTDDDVRRWEGIVAAMASATRKGRGAVRFEGELIDEAHVETAEAGLDLVRRLGGG